MPNKPTCSDLHVEIIAEIGNSHEGSVGLAKQFIKTAANCGVDAVKFQTHIFDAESLPDAPNPPYFKDESRKEYFTRTAFDFDQLIKLKAYAEDECSVEFISSPFSLEAVILLEKVGVRTYKIPSGEVTTHELLTAIARTKKRVLLSSGMSSWTEIDAAVKVLKENGCSNLLLMQCTSEYPCMPQNSGLNIIEELVKRYQVPVGYSDHTIGNAVPLAAVVLGAKVIEKHFVLSRDMYGSDAKNSTEPEEFKNLVDEIRALEIALASKVDKNAKATSLQGMKETFEKSIVAVENLPKGTILELKHFAYKKPGDGIRADRTNTLLGKKLAMAISKNQQYTKEHVQ